MLRPERSEARLATLLIGTIQVLWSALPVTGGDWRLLRVLVHYGQTLEWLLVMGTLGAVLMAGAICRWRSGRQIGLILSCGIWAGYFFMWIHYGMETEKWVVSPVFLTAPLLSLFCLGLFVNDVLQKPRQSKESEDVVA